jgi:class 3 adenylate cyclase
MTARLTGAMARCACPTLPPRMNPELAKRLGRTTLFSADFAARCGAEIMPLGDFALAGFRETVPVFGLADESG